MSKKGHANPLPGKGAPLSSGAYNWTRSFSHGGSEMIGDANRSGKSGRRSADRGPAIFTLALIGLALTVGLIGCLIDLL